MAAVSIISRPDDYNEVGNCIKWVLRMTGVVTETTESRLVYWLVDDSGNQLTYPDQIRPGEGQAFPIDLSGELKRKVHTEPPPFNNSVNSVVDQPEMIIEFSLKYKIVTFDKETCDTTEEGEQTDGPFKAINVASNWYKPMILNGTLGQVINHKPRLIHVSPTSEDWLYVWNEAYLFIGFYTANHTNISGNFFPQSTNEKVSAWAVGPGNLGSAMPPNTAYYKVFVFEGGLQDIHIVSETTYVIDCEDDNMDLYFFDGGYSGISMTRQSRGVTGTQSVVNQYNASCDPFSIDNLRRKGPTANNKVDYSTIILEKEMDDEREDTHEFFRRAKVAGNYYIRHPFGFGGNGRMIKFLVTSRSIVYDRPDSFPVLRIVGQINVPFRTANHFV